MNFACCCNNLYDSSGGALCETRICDPTYYRQLARGISSPFISIFTNYAFDHKNEKVYVGGSGGLYRLDKDLTGITLINSSYNLVSSWIAVDYVNGRIFFTRNSATLTCQIRRVNFDGSGDTLIQTHTNSDTDASGTGYLSINYDRANDTIYYHMRDTHTSTIGAPPDTYQCLRSNSDGTGESTIIANGNGLQARQMSVDKTNSKLWWIAVNPSSAHYQIYHSDLDGSSPTLWLDTGAFANPVLCLQWNHKQQRLWWAESIPSSTPTSSTSGLFSNNFAGTDLRQELHGNATVMGVAGGMFPPNMIYLACGIEQTGLTTAA